MEDQQQSNSTISLTKDDLSCENLTEPTLSTAESTFPESHILIKKTIVKLKKTKCKQYKKKILYITPIVAPLYTFNHKFMIYGFIEVETFYKNYNSNYDIDLVNMCAQVTKVRQIEKNLKEQCLKVSLENTGQSGFKDFQFLIDHFSKFSDQNYQELKERLQKYQAVANIMQEHVVDVSRKVKSRIISEEDIEKANEDYEEYFKSYIKKNYKENEFITYGLIQLDHESQDLEQKYICLSLATLSLLGIEPIDLEHKFIHSKATFTQLLGLDRIKNLVRHLDYFSGESYQISYPQKIVTADSLTFMSHMTVEIVFWEDRPSWMSKYSKLGLVCKHDVSLNQLKAIIDMRAKQSQDQFYLFSNYSDQLFEYTVQSEIFLEKFYPELYQNPESRKAIAIKKPKVVLPS